jgi:hypothetical protein
MPNKSEAELVEFVAVTTLLLGVRSFSGLRPQSADRDPEGVGKGLEDGEALDRLNAALYLGDPALGAAERTCQLALRESATAP